MTDIKWHHFLTGKDDATIDNITFLSRPAEWHAVGVGFVAGITASKTVLTALAMYLLGRSNKFLAILDNLPDTLHARDAVREPAYAAGGAVVGFVVHSLLWGIPVVLPF